MRKRGGDGVLGALGDVIIVLALIDAVLLALTRFDWLQRITRGSLMLAVWMFGGL